MKSFSGKVAAITGAGSGIGQATAIALARQGCHLAISDLNEDSLQETVELLAAFPIRVSTHLVDVSDREAVYCYAENTVSEHGKVNLIMNNAGVGLGENIENMSYDNFAWLMNINFWGVVYGTRAFLPHLKDTGEGHVVNVSSVFGMIGVPTQSAYNAAKFAVRGFTESLREELDIERRGVSATSVHPGGVKTSIARNSRMGDMGAMSTFDSKEEIADWFERIARTTPDSAARTIVAGVRRNRRRVLVGADAVMLDAAQRLMPTGYQRLIEALFSVDRRRKTINRSA
jgi:NADP-dependent 3-hydroxy acid dehydrogenase YdfG